MSMRFEIIDGSERIKWKGPDMDCIMSMVEEKYGKKSKRKKRR